MAPRNISLLCFPHSGSRNTPKLPFKYFLMLNPLMAPGFHSRKISAMTLRFIFSLLSSGQLIFPAKSVLLWVQEKSMVLVCPYVSCKNRRNNFHTLYVRGCRVPRYEISQAKSGLCPWGDVVLGQNMMHFKKKKKHLKHSMNI